MFYRPIDQQGLNAKMSLGSQPTQSSHMTTTLIDLIIAVVSKIFAVFSTKLDSVIEKLGGNESNIGPKMSEKIQLALTDLQYSKVNTVCRYSFAHLTRQNFQDELDICNAVLNLKNQNNNFEHLDALSDRYIMLHVYLAIKNSSLEPRGLSDEQVHAMCQSATTSFATGYPMLLEHLDGNDELSPYLTLQGCSYKQPLVE